MINIAVCDDDSKYSQHFIRDLKKYEKQFGERFDCIYYCNANDVVCNIAKDLIDVYFINMELSNIRGNELAKIIKQRKRNAGIAYITNYNNYAVKVFTCRPLGCIRKSHEAEDIDITIENMIDFIKEIYKLYIFYNNTKPLELNLKSIQYIIVNNHEVELVMISNERKKIRDKISRFENDLCNSGFVKINRSCLINLSFIKNVIDNVVIMRDENKLYISESRINLVVRQWQGYIIGD